MMETKCVRSIERKTDVHVTTNIFFDFSGFGPMSSVAPKKNSELLKHSTGYGCEWLPIRKRLGAERVYPS